MDTSALLNEFVLEGSSSPSNFSVAGLVQLDSGGSYFPSVSMASSGDVPPVPYLVCKPHDSPNGSGILVKPFFIDAHFRKAWMPYFRKDGHPVVTSQAFLEFLGDHLPQEADLPILTGEELYDVALAKNQLLAVLMAGLGMRLKLFLHLGLSVLPSFFVK